MIEIIKDYFTQMLDQNPVIQQTTYSENLEIINGSYKISHAVIDKGIKINGQAHFGEGVRAEKKILVNGSLVSRQTTFELGLEVNGTASLYDSNVKENAVFSGVMGARNTVFASHIYLLTKQSNFDHCQLESVFFQSLPGKNSVQKLWLTDGTTVVGDVVFQSGIGEVYTDQTSVIHGHVVGGSIMQK